MSRSEAIRELERQRAHVSHTLFENGLGGGLVPGWRDERGGEADVVLRALRGDSGAMEAVRGASAYWRTTVEPALTALLAAVSDRFGFVTTETWEREVEEVEKAGRVISAFARGREVTETDDAEGRAAEFWLACDRIRLFLADMRGRSMEFFERWDPETARGSRR